LEKQKLPYETVKLPLLTDAFGDTITLYDVRMFFELCYSGNSIQLEEYYVGKGDTVLTLKQQYNFYAMTHLTYYFDCAKLEKNLETVIASKEKLTSVWLWHSLFLVETYNRQHDLKAPLISQLGWNLKQHRTANEEAKTAYALVWNKLSRSTCEQILELAYTTICDKYFKISAW
jgi:hypothetical protein